MASETRCDHNIERSEVMDEALELPVRGIKRDCMRLLRKDASRGESKAESKGDGRAGGLVDV
jgi:hypothetical protein